LRGCASEGGWSFNEELAEIAAIRILFLCGLCGLCVD